MARADHPAKSLWYQDVGGRRIYDSPAAYGAAPPAGGGGALHKNTTWDQNSGAWDQGIDWGKVYAWGTGAALGAGALSAGGAFGGAAGSGGGASSLTVPDAGLGYGGFGLGGEGVGAGGSTLGGNVGWLDTAKSIYSGFNKAKTVYDTGRSALGDLSGDFGAMAGAGLYGRAQGRVDEAGVQQAQDRLALIRAQLLNQNAETDLAQRKFQLEAPGTRAGTAVRGDILANAQDATIAPGTLGPNVHVPTISGGLRPSMFSDSTRQLGGLLSSQALAGQQAGDTFTPIVPPPNLTPLPQAGGFDTFLNTAGAVGTGMDHFLQWLKRYQANKPKPTTPPFTTPGGPGPVDPTQPDWTGDYS